MNLLFSVALVLLCPLSNAFYARTTLHSKTRDNKFTSMTARASVSFSKYQGLGNDFILVDNRGSSEPIFTPDQAISLCNRNFGIGADGVIFALPGKDSCDYTMRIYNSDGSEPQMCGNGIRCMARYLQEIEGKKEPVEQTYRISTNAGPIVPKVCLDGTIRVDMGKPILTPEKVPTTLSATVDGAVVEGSIEAAGASYKVNCISMGNPHAVIFLEDLDKMEPAFDVVGPVMERHPAFPQRVNAEFAQVLCSTHIRMKVWERGAGPTLACGTGACATVVAGFLSGRTERSGVTVSLPGGDLLIDWDATDGKIYMTGPAELAFRGVVSPP